MVEALQDRKEVPDPIIGIFPGLQQNYGSNMVPGTALIMPLSTMDTKALGNKSHIMLPSLSNCDTVVCVPITIAAI